MIIRTTKEVDKRLKIDGRIYRNCELDAENAVDFAEHYGWDTELIGTLRVIPNLGDGAYHFSVDEIHGSDLHALQENNTRELHMMKLALEFDFGLLPDEYEILQ